MRGLFITILANTLLDMNSEQPIYSAQQALRVFHPFMVFWKHLKKDVFFIFVDRFNQKLFIPGENNWILRSSSRSYTFMDFSDIFNWMK
jgi:hypothetical protein